MYTRLRRRITDMRALSTLMTTAERYAHDDGLGEPGAEHLVAAALAHPDRRAAALLRPWGVDTETFLTAIRQVHAAALDGIAVEAPESPIDDALPPAPEARGLYHAAPSAQQLLRRVAERSRSFDSAAIVREAARSSRGTVALALRELGVPAGGLTA